MIKIIVGFLLVFLAFYVGIDTFRQLTGKEKLDLTKSLFYTIICGSAAVGTIAAIILLF